MVLIRDIYVDSRRRTEPSGNSYTMYIQNTLKNVEKVDLVTATIPNTVYNITDGDRVMVLGSTYTIDTATLTFDSPVVISTNLVQVVNGNCSVYSEPISMGISGTTTSGKTINEYYNNVIIEFYVNTHKERDEYDPSLLPDGARIHFRSSDLENLQIELTFTGYIPYTLQDVTDNFNYTFYPTELIYSVLDFMSGTISVINASVTINPGFYSACNIVSTLIGAFPPELGISGKFIEAEGKIVFYSTSSFTIVINSQELSSISGFTQGIPYNAVLDGTTYYVKSNTVVNMKSLGDYIFLDILELRRPYESDAVSDVYNSESFINFATIPMDVNSGSIKTFKEMSDYRISVTYPKFIDQIDRLTINWLDTNGNSINFNGVDDNSFILRFYMKDDERIKAPDFSEKALLPKKMITSDVRNYFIFTLLSILFILFIKNK
jgi:hypothetical protein